MRALPFHIALAALLSAPAFAQSPITFDEMPEEFEYEFETGKPLDRPPRLHQNEPDLRDIPATLDEMPEEFEPVEPVEPPAKIPKKKPEESVGELGNDDKIVGQPLPPPEEEAKTYTALKLQSLNKVTAHVSTLEGPVGTVLRFGTLEIIARNCVKSSPEEQPENAALLDIWENKPDEGPQQIFLGWMFSSSPGLSSLQHPVYDISVSSCENPKLEEEKPAKPSKKKAAAKDLR